MAQAPVGLSSKLSLCPSNWSLFFDSYLDVCSLHHSHCISAQCPISLSEKLWSLSGRLCIICYLMQTQVPLRPCIPVIVELVLRKAKYIWPQDLCICCSRSQEHPSYNTCVACSLHSAFCSNVTLSERYALTIHCRIITFATSALCPLSSACSPTVLGCLSPHIYTYICPPQLELKLYEGKKFVLVTVCFQYLEQCLHVVGSWYIFILWIMNKWIYLFFE